jgi:hypothetical protein
MLAMQNQIRLINSQGSPFGNPNISCVRRWAIYEKSGEANYVMSAGDADQRTHRCSSGLGANGPVDELNFPVDDSEPWKV